MPVVNENADDLGQVSGAGIAVNQFQIQGAIHVHAEDENRDRRQMGGGKRDWQNTSFSWSSVRTS